MYNGGYVLISESAQADKKAVDGWPMQKSRISLNDNFTVINLGHRQDANYSSVPDLTTVADIKEQNETCDKIGQVESNDVDANLVRNTDFTVDSNLASYFSNLNENLVSQVEFNDVDASNFDSIFETIFTNFDCMLEADNYINLNKNLLISENKDCISAAANPSNDNMHIADPDALTSFKKDDYFILNHKANVTAQNDIEIHHNGYTNDVEATTLCYTDEMTRYAASILVSMYLDSSKDNFTMQTLNDIVNWHEKCTDAGANHLTNNSHPTCASTSSWKDDFVSSKDNCAVQSNIVAQYNAIISDKENLIAQTPSNVGDRDLLLKNIMANPSNNTASTTYALVCDSENDTLSDKRSCRNRCPACSKVFTQARNFKYHKKYSCPKLSYDRKKFSCPDCGYVLKHEGRLKLHKKTNCKAKSSQVRNSVEVR